jgi:hypothetical protein
MQASLVVATAVVVFAFFVVSGRAGIVHRRGEMVGSRCYTVCPPVIYPTGHDPYYESSYFTLERELHGGPFGPGTLNPFNTNDPRNYVPRVAPHPFGQKLFSYAPPRNPMNPTYVGSLLETASNTAAPHPAAPKATAPNSVKLDTSFLQVGLTATTKHSPRSGMCLHVCPSHKVTDPASEPLGGPFGPDPYFTKSKRMFVNRQGLSGYSQPGAHFSNRHNDPYGGPFGADPYYVYGQDSSAESSVPNGYAPHPRL